MHGAVAEQGAVAVGVEARATADALLHQAVEVDARDAQAADGVARLQAAAEEHGQAAHDLRRRGRRAGACRRWRRTAENAALCSR